MKKPLRKVAFGLIVFGLIGGSIYASGILVKPNFLTTKSLDEVPVYDILSFQAHREQEILAEVRLEQYSFSDPYVIIDPYEMNPLSALVAFEVDSAAEYVITVLANHAYAQLTTRVFYDPGIVALPIIGLFPDTVNTVLIDNGQSIITLRIETEPLPQDFQNIDVIESKPEQMQEGFTLFVACFDHSYTALVDQDGAIRAYFSNTDMAHGTSVISLPNGHLLGTGDELKQVPYNMTSLWEFDWLGRVYQEIELPNGAHHDLSLLPDGKVLVVSNHERMFETGTREDVALIVDLQTGDILTTYDFRTILDETRAPFNNFHPNILNALNIDWMHMNGAVYDPQNDWLIVSSPIQSQVVAIDAKTKEIQWILGPHEGYEGSSAFLKSYLLTPIGEDFQWQWAQHHPMIMADLDWNPDTIDLMMLDNGQSKSFTQENAVQPQNNTSRAVHYRIDLRNFTVEQIWDYGTQRGNELYATFLGDANRMDNGNTLIAFGGQLRQDGIAVDHIIDGVLGKVIITSRVVEVDAEKNVVFEVSVTPGDQSTSAETYQAVRIDLSRTSSLTSFGTLSLRKGTLTYSSLDQTTPIPNITLGELSATFNKLIRENDRLIIDGNLLYQGKTRLLGQAVIVLRSWNKTYAFKSNSGLNGRFFSSIDLSLLKEGIYEISIAGGVKEGNDVLSGKLYKGYFKTGYKLTIDY